MHDSNLFNILKQNNYILPKDPDASNEIIDTMLSYLSSVDSELRDNIAYNIFFEWFVGQDNLTTDQKRRIYNYAVNKNNLLFKINIIDSDAVFQRSFLALIIALLLENNKVHNFLTDNEIRKTLNLLIELLEKEKNTHSFIEEKGWAHCIAHTADSLDELIYQSTISEIDVKKIMTAITFFYKTNPNILTGEEDERLSNILITALFEQKINIEEVKNWLNSLSETIPNHLPEIPLINIKQFTQTLLIKLTVLNYDVDFNLFPIVTRYIRKNDDNATNKKTL
ncbi:DUF2785 domain-containing protein [Listeria monocytogenes]|uniref:DUF2785 domain-containing protein n=1 Tax=Listeria monocytogenes serotype 4a (strain M7) TaxID=1030009 RepID=A0A0E0UVC5_LISMM|nr:DUF2785 domain-containing protein [Listeria monocytogenes]ACK39610.1 conserved hypothetical protein [Listeria monocytogenes HCC23]AEH92397.1 hypothetical protein LMM7_1392 [Listeria monocytogenes M7]AKS53893.1 hypothetical protein LM850658_06480 [Listeria monocytogenes]EAC6860366.1 DUF2785 domain-containing protein [Listeria monocytogenes]EAD0182998.1 DUF2785 domain-containing protein [Listeria monocytogenes]